MNSFLISLSVYGFKFTRSRTRIKVLILHEILSYLSNPVKPIIELILCELQKVKLCELQFYDRKP